MFKPSRHSITSRLTWMNMLVSGAGLLLAGAAFLGYELITFRQAMIQSLSGQAQTIGVNSASAILFNDPKSAEETLAALRTQPHIISAGIYGADGRQFAAYCRHANTRAVVSPQIPPGQMQVQRLTMRQLVIARRIIFQEKPLATVVIQSDLEGLKSRLIQFAVIGILVIATALLIVVRLSSRLRRTISEPIVSLASTAKIVSSQKNYSIRAVATDSDDEIRVLIDSFNEMLGQIQQHDVEVRKLNEELERRVVERTVQLEGVNNELAGQLAARHQVERALHEKNIELENANRAKDAFLASMSHELRTPLNAIIGFTGTLLMKLPGPLTDEQAKQLRTVQSSAKHLLSLINDLLDLAKIGSGKVTLNVEPVVFQHVLEEVRATLRPLAEKKGLELEITVPETEVVGNTDRRALSQILLNLTNNAIKFTEHGEVRIVLNRQSYDGKNWTQLSVHDTGIGIKPEDQPKLFQAFSQVDGARRHEGTGLGLQLSQKLAELLGGRIHFKSEYGKGSTFTLSLSLD
jgi:signal transduction histidine kinase